MARIIIYRKVIIYCIFLLFLPPGKAIAGPNNVFFSEIAWAGSSVSASDEWIELKNNTDFSINMDGWQITRWNSSTNKDDLMISLSGSILANDIFVAGNNSATSTFSGGQSALIDDPNYINSAISLSNDSFQLKLYDGQFDDGRLPIDIAGNKSNPLAGSNVPKSSMVRKIPLTSGSFTDGWYSANLSNGYDNGISDFGTPGLFNKAKPVATILCDSVKIPVNQTTQLSCFGDVYDYNGENVSADISANSVNESLNINNGQWSWKSRLTATQNFYIYLTVTNNSNLQTVDSIAIATYTLTSKIVINEVVPDPPSGEEWIEIYNQSNQDIDLVDWQLDDKLAGGSKPYIFSHQIIKAGQYLSLNKSLSGIGLNNDGDELYLLDPLGNIVDQTNYGSVTSNKTWVRLNDRAFAWSNFLSKDQSNNLPERKNYDNLVKINELMPNPTGSDEEKEWVELLSQSAARVDLSGWLLDDEDGGSAEYKFPANTVLEPHQFFLIKRGNSNIAFNNDSDEVRLFAPDGTLIDALKYADVKENQSYSYFEAGWEWTNQPTPELVNQQNNNEIINSSVDTPIVTPSQNSVIVVSFVVDENNKIRQNPAVVLPDHLLDKIVLNLDNLTGLYSNKILGLQTKKRSNINPVLFIVYISGIIIFWKIDLWQTKYLLTVKKNWKSWLQKLKPG